MKHPFLFLKAGAFTLAEVDHYLLFKDSVPDAVIRKSVMKNASLQKFHENGLWHLKASNRIHRDKLQSQVERWLLELHSRIPLALVVRRAGKASLSDWHFESVSNVNALMEVLSSFARRSIDYAPRKAKIDGGIIGGGKIGRFFEETVAALEFQMSAEQSSILFDLLQEKLPTLSGRNFELDVALRNVLSTRRQVSLASIEMPEAFHKTFLEITKRHHKEAESWSTKGVEKQSDWSSVAGVRSQLASAVKRGKLECLFEASNEAHVELFLSLSLEEQVQLCNTKQMATRLCNAATFAIYRNDYETALKLYDCVMQAPSIDANAAANPLYVVQNDNSHLGIMPERAKVYLSKCLPYAKQNPAVELNASGVYMELEQFDEAMACLMRAAASGYDVKNHLNDALYIALRERAEFKALMKK
jgi:tetratricopeptide (TPR) repeat protein